MCNIATVSIVWISIRWFIICLLSASIYTPVNYDSLNSKYLYSVIALGLHIIIQYYHSYFGRMLMKFSYLFFFFFFVFFFFHFNFFYFSQWSPDHEKAFFNNGHII